MAGDAILDQLFNSFPTGVTDVYTPLQGLYVGKNASIIVAERLNSDQRVVLRLYRRLFEDHRKALMALRNIKYSSQLSHPNVLKALNICGKKAMLYTDVFYETEFIDMNLHELLSNSNIYFKQPSDKQSLVRQILLGLAYIHSAQIVHRNLQPKHILYKTATRTFLIADFNHAVRTGIDENNMTKSITRSSYSAPEVTLCPQRLTTASDIYSAGLILIQVLRVDVTPFLEQKTGMMYIEQIFQKTGSPTEDDLRDLPTAQARFVIEKISPNYPKRTWAELFPTMSPQETQLIDQMLQFPGSSRISALGALQSAYFDGLGDVNPNELQYTGPAMEDYRDMTMPAIFKKIRDSINVDITTAADTDQLRPFA